MSKPLHILVIEPNQASFAYLRGYCLNWRLHGLPREISLTQIADLKTFQRYADFREFDAVITNVIFASSLHPSERETPLPNGKLVVEYCLSNNKPVVWLSTFQDSSIAEEQREWGLQRGVELIDNIPVTSRVICWKQSSAISNMWIKALMAVLAKAAE